MDRTTLTAAMKPLERRGLVEVQVDKADRRSRLLVLTNAGREALASALPIWRATHQDVEAVLQDPDILRRELMALA
jgi:DNA-binding MarR family transcriptional regulator